MVYFIADDPGYGEDVYVKIGFTLGVAQDRLKALQVGNPRTLFLVYSEPGGIELETELHILCSEFRVRGEWFSYNKEVVDLLKPGIRNRRLDYLDRLKEQTWLDEIKEIKEITKKYENIRNELQEDCSLNMFYLTPNSQPKKGKK